MLLAYVKVLSVHEVQRENGVMSWVRVMTKDRGWVVIRHEKGRVVVVESKTTTQATSGVAAVFLRISMAEDKEDKKTSALPLPGTRARSGGGDGSGRRGWVG